MTDKPKPRGFRAFNSLARKLAAVPKEQADAKMAERIKRRRRKSKK